MSRARDLADSADKDITGTLTVDAISSSGDITLADNAKAIFGAGSDLQIYHNSTAGNSYIDDAGTGWLYLRADERVLVASQSTGNISAKFFTNAQAELAYNNATKLATTATGVDVTGTVTAENLQTTSAGRIFSGNGGNASNPMIANGSDQDTGIHFPAADTMALGTGGTNRLYLNSSGYVGVSNAVPEAALDVRGHTRLGNRITSATDYTTELSGFGVVSGANRYGSYGMLGFYASSGYTGGARTFAITNAYAANKFAILYGNNSTTVPSIGTGGSVVDGNLALAIDGSGNVGIGTSPNQKLSVAGTIESTSTSTAFYATGVGNYNQQNGSGGTAWAYGSGGGTAAPGTASTTFGMHHWNGNSWKNTLNIDTSGRVTMPYQPAFHAHGTSSSWTVFSNGGWTTLVLPATTLNTGNHYNTGSSAFTAPVAGVYHFYYKVYGRVQSGGPASTYWMSRFFKNNSGITGSDVMLMGYQYNTGGSDETATYSMNISLAANDQITLHAQSSGAYNGEYYPVYCDFGGYLIG